uniref:Purine-nucleoside phosphorylase n=1 Tax=Thermosporothrix sp. COM3 TaxID=2490863 RepID=A0A455SDV4_9CHLR|nr:purine-nucleoside phosphorylase [Thermosporothrix sp. COM3]
MAARKPIRLVSACMTGTPCRYNGQAKPDPRVIRLVEHQEAIAVCPEMLGGLSTPRRPAEIVGGDGDDVLDGKARVIDDSGQDVTEAFLAGAHQALKLAQAAGAREAILKEFSPSCGCATIYDGTFSGKRQAGTGVTAALLRRYGIVVRSELALEE